MSINFTTMTIKASRMYEENPLVDIKNVAYIHAGYKESDSCKANEPKFFGEGMVDSMLPYLQLDNYSETLEDENIRIATIENDYLKATILIDFGGRLYSLYDKKENRELLYKNEVLKFCNLSLLNAWFSGGVEWNVSIKGHNPLTCSKMFSSIIKGDNLEGLRIYEYERKRKICYSVDFILPMDSKFLIVIPRIENTESENKYNYWWSNIAVKETESTRIIVPAKKAYISSYNRNAYFIDYKDVPFIDGRDSSYPKSSPCSNDYFYKIDDNDEKWIASVEADGKGFIQASTKLLKGRKMFVWGNSEGGKNWQKLLSDNKGSYTEIQAGLMETQLQHFLMNGNTKIEWVEAYGPLSINKEDAEAKDYNVPVNACLSYLNEYFKGGIDNTLKEYLNIKFETEKIVSYGSGWGAFNNCINNLENKKPVSLYLDFPVESMDDKQKIYLELLKNGYIKEKDVNTCPSSYEITEFMRNKLLSSLEHAEGVNWTTYYLLGSTYYGLGDNEYAHKYWMLSYDNKPNAWSARNLSMYYKNILKDTENAYKWIMKAYALSKDFCIIKDTAVVLLDTLHYEDYLEIFDILPLNYQKSGRLLFYKAFALDRLDRDTEASLIINYDFNMHDVREGEISISDLWYKIYGKLLLNNYGKLSEKEIEEKIDVLMPLKNQDYRMHR